MNGPSYSRILLVLALSTIGICFMIDLHLTRKYGGVDLRDKVVGSRSLLEGRSPYTEPWRPGDPERFADPLVPPGSEYTRFTGSPFQALITAPLAWPPFSMMRLVWLFIQYAMLVAIIALMLRSFGAGSMHAMLGAFAVLVAITTSGAWRLHVERGQIYVIMALMMALLFQVAGSRKDLLIGALGASLVLFKPTFGILLLPLVFKLTPKMIGGGIAMLLIAAVPFLFLPDGFNSWHEYVATMKVWGQHPTLGFIPPTMAADFAYPATIEGVSGMDTFHEMETENGSVTTILMVFGMNIPGILPYLITFVLFLASTLLIGWRNLRKAALPDLLLFGFCLFTILMMLLPVFRFHYQFVLWTAPLLYVLIAYRNAPVSWYLLAGLAGLLVVGAIEILPVNVLMAEAILLILIGYYLLKKLRPIPGDPRFDHT